MDSKKNLKRTASSEEEPLEEATNKRPRRDKAKYEVGAHTAPKKSSQKAVRKPRKEHAPSLNPIPQPTTHHRPPAQLFVWGMADNGQLGLGTDSLDELFKPRSHAFCENAIQAGRFGPQGAGIEKIAAGGMHSFMIDEEGKVWSWGVNDDSALGRQTDNVLDSEGNKVDEDELAYNPHVIESLVKEKFRAVSVAAGDSLGAVLNDQGELRIWGTFRSPEGSKGFSTTAKPVEGVRPATGPSTNLQPISLYRFHGVRLSAIAAGINHVLALSVDGAVYAWGSSEQGQLARKVLSRHRKIGLEPEGMEIKDAVVIGCGSYHSFAVDRYGTVWAWGLNNYGQLGFKSGSWVSDSVHGTIEDVDTLHPSVTGSKVVQIVGGEHHTLFRLEDGRVYAVGRNDGGQLGVPGNHPAILADPESYGKGCFIPVQVPIDEPVVEISAGTTNSLALTESGKLYSWGQGYLGIDSDTEETFTPTLIAGKSAKWQCLSISCGGQHSLALFRRKDLPQSIVQDTPGDGKVSNGVH